MLISLWMEDKIYHIFWLFQRYQGRGYFSCTMTWALSRVVNRTPRSYMGSIKIKFGDSHDISLSWNSCKPMQQHWGYVTTLHLTRTGQRVTLFNPSFYEPDTAFKCLNEVLHLLTLPPLDEFFRDENTGELKLEWTLIVDNGPAEQPTKASPGSKEHRANNECISEEIRGCIIQGFLHAFCGVKPCDFIFLQIKMSCKLSLTAVFPSQVHRVKCWPPYWGRENCLAGQVHHCLYSA